MRRAPLTLGASIESMRRRLGMAPVSQAQQLETVWEELAGPELAALTRSVTLRDERLVIVVTDPAAVEVARWRAGALADAMRDRSAGVSWSAVVVRTELV